MIQPHLSNQLQQLSSRSHAHAETLGKFFAHSQFQIRQFSFASGSGCRLISNNFSNKYSLQLHIRRELSRMSQSRVVKIGVVQMTSTSRMQHNIDICNQLIEKAKAEDAKMVFFPEAFDFIAENRKEGQELADSIEGSTVENFKEKAKALNIWLSLGGFHEKKTLSNQETDPTKSQPWMANSHLIINNEGDVVSKYDKIHMFDMDSPSDNIALKESSAVIPGNQIVPPVHTPVGNLGLGICYDLRFPEFSLRLRQAGAEVLTFPSAFTVPTGQAHWEVLLRARAIENQCFVIAAAQYGKHNEKRTSYGHAMVIDPFGKILCEAEDMEEPQLLTATLDLGTLSSVRSRMPVIKHRRPDVYGLEPIHAGIPFAEEGENTFAFGQVNVKQKMVFLEQNHSRAFVNKKCVLPGHVLVISKRQVARLKELTPTEISDLFQLVHRVERLMEEIQQSTSTTIAIQDGPDAGQSIEHVHVHIVPRKSMDLESNDSIYNQLSEHDKGEVRWREEGEMVKECNQIRNFILEHHPEWLIG